MSRRWTEADLIARGYHLHAVPLRQDTSEADLQGRLQKLCTDLGFLYWHVVGKAAKTSTAGLPDALILHPDAPSPVLYAWELKREGEQPSPAQRRWLEALARVQQIETATYYPHDWPTMVDRLTIRLQK